MLKPKQTKYIKQHRGRKTGKITRPNKNHLGEFCLQSKEAFWLTSKQIEATRRAIIRCIKKEGRLFICVFPHKPITTRTVESRMGAGKGNLNHWVAVIKPGTILFEIAGVSLRLLKKVVIIASQKLPIQIKLISNL